MPSRSWQRVPPERFIKLLAAGEIAVGSALLAPVVPSVLAGAALTGFSGSLVTSYLRTPASLHKPGRYSPAAATQAARSRSPSALRARSCRCPALVSLGLLATVVSRTGRRHLSDAGRDQVIGHPLHALPGLPEPPGDAGHRHRLVLQHAEQMPAGSHLVVPLRAPLVLVRNRPASREVGYEQPSARLRG